jgi:hypothetical protein
MIDDDGVSGQALCLRAPCHRAHFTAHPSASSVQARQGAMAALESAARFRIPPHAQQQLARLTTAALV